MSVRFSAGQLTYLNMDGPHLVLVDALTSKLTDLERLLRHLLARRSLPVAA